MHPRKTLRLIRRGSKNVSFADLKSLAEAFGFVHVRTSGSHHIFNHPALPGMLNLQPDGNQVRQLMRLVERYGLTLSGAEEEE
jgi:HicA toxin of bacterial toxin-antitoxin,